MVPVDTNSRNLLLLQAEDLLLVCAADAPGTHHAPLQARHLACSG